MSHLTRIVFAAVLALGLCMLTTGCGEEPQPPAAPATSTDSHADHDHDHDHDHGDEEGTTSAHDIMETINKGKPSMHKQIGIDLAAIPPKWDDVAAQMPQYVELASALPSASPERGDEASWKVLANAYAAGAVALNEAIEAKNQPAALAAHTALDQSCKPCHDLHR